MYKRVYYHHKHIQCRVEGARYRWVGGEGCRWRWTSEETRRKEEKTRSFAKSASQEVFVPISSWLLLDGVASDAECARCAALVYMRLATRLSLSAHSFICVGAISGNKKVLFFVTREVKRDWLCERDKNVLTDKGKESPARAYTREKRGREES